MSRVEPTDRAMARAVERWFAQAARPLPWRTTPRDPWASLVSEVMAQQTQISRVLERYPAFMARFPTPRSLADAHEQEVLALWRGMGYYRRARLLHAAARAIVERHEGRVPGAVEDLRALPGVGRYTAGAVASIAMGRAEAIVDGNVARVLLRVHGREGRAGDRDTDRWCWQRAAELVGTSSDAGTFNEGLMELGALVCTPGPPRCEACPLAGACIARREGTQDRIPAPKERGPTPLVQAVALVAIDAAGRVLLERRPSGAMWGGLWQVPTLESAAPIGPAALRRWANGPVGRSVARFEFRTTHRLFAFDVRRVACDPLRAESMASSAPSKGVDRRWLSVAEAAELPLSSPQGRVVSMAASWVKAAAHQKACEAARPRGSRRSAQAPTTRRRATR